MKNLFPFSLLVFFHFVAVADEQHFLSGGMYMGSAAVFTKPNIIIENGASVYPDDNRINLNTTSTLYNYGDIHGQIYTNGYNLTVHNAGGIEGGVEIKSGDALFQIIDSESEFVPFNVVGDNFNVRINNVQNIDLDRIKNLHANNVVLDNTSVVINDFSDWQNWNDSDVLLLGSKALYITNSYTVNSGEYINFLTSEDDVTVVFMDSDKLHKPELVRDSHGVLLNIVRETDYSKIFENKRGVLLSNVRSSNPNDKLLVAMDGVESLSELDAVMSRSYRFKPVMLMHPIDVMNKFIVFDVLRNRNEVGFGSGVAWVDGDKVHGGYGRLFSGFSVDKNIFNIGLNVNNAWYSDNYNDFSATTYGMNVNAKIDLDKYWLNMGLIGNITKFKADNIYSNNDIKNNPNGYSGNITTDAGYDYKVNTNFTLSPFAGMVIDYKSVLDYTNTEMNLRIGSALKYEFVLDNIKYVYDGFGAVATNGDMFGAVKIGVQSDVDDFGANIGVDILKSDIDLNYRFSINANILF